MPKILDLRKKNIRDLQSSQKPRGEVNVEKRMKEATIQSKTIEQKNEITYDQKPHIFWEAPSFYYNPQKRYLSLVIFGLLSAAVALLIIRYNVLTSIFLILASIVLMLYSSQKPITSKIVVNQSGILVDEKMYNYKELRSFWINYNPGGLKELSIESSKWYLPYIKVLLSDQNPVELRSLMINFLPEREHENSLIDHISKKLGL